MKKICVVTGTRADYGLLKWVMEGIVASTRLELQLIVTGMHLSPEFGLTVNAIENDGFVADKKIDILLSSDTPVAISKSTGLGIIGFSEAFEQLQPDLLILLGDRFEIFAAATAALFSKIPIAHLHGGETTQGAFDEAIRHSITKMSHYHFVSAKAYRNRVIQLGEDPDKVFEVGGLGVDTIRKTNLLTKEELEKQLGLKFLKRNLLVTFHPITLSHESSDDQFIQILEALDQLQQTLIIFTLPNADTESRSLIKLVQAFCDKKPNANFFVSLGSLRYLSCVKCVEGIVGNSSSGLLEAPTLKTGTINIGDRQKGRLQSTSVINCNAQKEDILKAIETLFSNKFQESLATTINPYGDGGASSKIIEIVERLDLNHSMDKKFHDLFPVC